MAHEITVGTKVEGNWGAMHPISEGVIVAVFNSTSLMDDVPKRTVTIKWNDDELLTKDDYYLSDIHQPGWISANGSPIGIFVAEEQ